MNTWVMGLWCMSALVSSNVSASFERVTTISDAWDNAVVQKVGEIAAYATVGQRLRGHIQFLNAVAKDTSMSEEVRCLLAVRVSEEIGDKLVRELQSLSAAFYAAEDGSIEREIMQQQITIVMAFNAALRNVGKAGYADMGDRLTRIQVILDELPVEHSERVSATGADGNGHEAVDALVANAAHLERFKTNAKIVSAVCGSATLFFALGLYVYHTNKGDN